MIKINISNEERNVLESIIDEVTTPEYTGWKEDVQNLFSNYFNPSKKRRRLYQNISELPETKSFDSLLVQKLEHKDLIEVLDNRKFSVPTPLGLLVNESGGQVSDDAILDLIFLYHKNTSYKLYSAIDEFGGGEELTEGEVAILVFLMYNNNLSKYQGDYSTNGSDEAGSLEEVQRAIDKITSSFKDNKIKSENTQYLNGSLSGYWLTEANRKLGLPIHNQDKLYYIEPNRVDEVKEAIESYVASNPSKARSQFESFTKSFRENKNVLYENGVLYATENSKRSIEELFKLKAD